MEATSERRRQQNASLKFAMAVGFLLGAGSGLIRGPEQMMGDFIPEPQVTEMVDNLNQSPGPHQSLVAGGIGAFEGLLAGTAVGVTVALGTAVIRKNDDEA